MSYTVCKATVTVVETTPTATNCNCYRSRLDMILTELEHGGIGDGFYGSESHLIALKGVILKAESLMKTIQATEREICRMVKENKGIIR